MRNISDGFTLIELIIVFSAIAVLSTFGIAAFINYNRDQTLNTAAMDVATMLNVAKSRALSQVTQNSSGSNLCATYFIGYRVAVSCKSGNPNCTGSDKDYELQVYCNNDIKSRIDSKDLPALFTFVSAKTILFRALTGGVEGAGTITINGYQGQTPKTITVTSDGKIFVN